MNKILKSEEAFASLIRFPDKYLLKEDLLRYFLSLVLQFYKHKKIMQGGTNPHAIVQYTQF